MLLPEDADYTLVIPYAQACELIAGRVPHDVVIACISGIKAMQETPADFVESRTRRKRATVVKKGQAA